MDHIQTLQNIGQSLLGVEGMDDMDSLGHKGHKGHMGHGDIHKSDNSEHRGMHHMGMMDMAMSFHGGCNETILFDFWKISDIGGLIGSMVGCFLMGVLYEGLKFYREFLLRRAYQTAQYNSVPRETSEGTSSAGPGESGDATSVSVVAERPATRGAIRVISSSLFSHSHLVQTLLHLVQVVLSYFLMLVAMTYNTWLFGAVAGGATVGYFIFGWSKAVVMDVGDHCH